MGSVRTVRVVSTHPESQGPCVLINEGDFDPAVHTLFEDPAAQAAGVPAGNDPPAEAPKARRKK